MVIVGITGTLSSGKEIAAKYLQLNQGFNVINLESPSWEETNPRSNYESEESCRIAIATQALKTIMKDLTQHYLVYPLTLPEELMVFRKRSYFICLGIDSPLTMRYANYCKKHGKPKNLLQGFIYIDDHTKYGLNGYPCRVIETLLSAERIIQNKGNEEEFYSQLRLLDLLNPEHSRPSWDTYFIRLAEMAATRSSCVSSKQGAIIAKDKKVISTGYNGTPAKLTNCNEYGCKFCNKIDDSECLCIHSEINALIEAGRNRTTGSDLYTTHMPCISCSKSILQSDIKRVIYSRQESFREDTFNFLTSANIPLILQFPAIASKVISNIENS
ncbi:hypothetical protein SteCoe_21221 [Stentor coeruleus]|uniref:dCMP deaminase n=1 Tax=Stentor coeruleus TaxID=5963 RepID=A0A1R2BQ15_9CILI|nr:hypothetical protein SteCoe_21221 [Stentor coeruleus]